jgi:hypothetical protein
LIASAFEEEGGHWRVVGDLFCVGGTAVDPTLEGLSELRVEGLLHVEIEDGVGDAKGYRAQESVQFICLLESFEQDGGIGHAADEALEVALSAEDVDGQTDVEDGLSRH